MIDLLIKNSDGIIKAFWETNFMMAVSMLVCLIFSLPLGILLFSLEKDYLLKNNTELNRSKLLNKNNLDSKYNYLLYAPTFRKKNN